jgi:hypothetical protein
VNCGGEPGKEAEREKKARKAFDSPPIPENIAELLESSDEEDNLPLEPPPQRPAMHSIDPKTYVLRPRSWLTYWAMIERANLRIRIVRTPYSCEVPPFTHSRMTQMTDLHQRNQIDRFA